MKKKLKPVTLENLDIRLEKMEVRLDNLTAIVAELSLQVAKIGVKCEELDTKFRFMMEAFGSLDKRIEALEIYTKERFVEIDYKFEVVFKKLDDIDSALAKKLDREEFLSFQKHLVRK